MARTLIVAEKPSVAREIAKVLGVNSRRGDGYLADARHVVTWAVGHLVNIAEPEEQDPAWAGRWSMNQLPMIPRKFKLAVLESSARQFAVVRSLMNADDVEEVINATDAGREGELIFRRIYLMAGCSKPIRRLWANDMTEQGLRRALEGTVPGEKKRNLGLAAFARAEADWLIGMNYSRLFTLKDRQLITVGRVQTPVLRLLVDRRREIENFTVQDYWTVEATMEREGESFSATWHRPPEFRETRVDVEAEASAIADKCRGREGVVDSTKSQQRQQAAPLPFDLTTLQREANSRYGLSAKDTLTIAQALYEQKKLLTYPRTDSRYLTTDLFAECLSHLRAVYHLFPDIAADAATRITEAGDAGAKRFACVNDKKVSDHHAIIPTARKADRNALSENEWRVYEMVCRRFIAAFLPPVKFAASTVWVVVEEERFKATGKVFSDRGWLAAEPWRTAADNPLPRLRKGSRVTVTELESRKHQTKPPAHYTDASLLAAMETAGKLVDDEELREAMKERGLGTPATRAQIIETLLSRKYVEKDGKKLVATDTGCHAVDLISAHLPDVTSAELTGDWEKKLGDIERGSFSYGEFMQAVRESVWRNVHAIRNHRAFDRDGFPVAPPRMGAPVASAPNPATPPSPAPPAAPTPAPVRYDADGFPIEDTPREAPRHAGEVMGVCPLCGRKVLEQPDVYECEGTLAGECSFGIKRRMFGGEILPNQMRDLLDKGRTFKRGRFVSREGKRFNANLRLTDGRLDLFFED
ncbi:DNA topoisomerase-3 [Desulfobaculum xiamenense]|uniref:DNA topoisomerase n=1 Tax=Desulfobaculum xiamenense TaxID=995050 RepID=A0A846QTZ2_9BACT|nr:DNA topoisomerase-3 [Desulfobaculum xiamenense]